MNNRHIVLSALCAAVAAAMLGCGGGSGSSEPPAAVATPQATNAMAQAFLDYQRTQTVTDTIEGSSLQKQLPAPDDTIEPSPIG